MDDASKTPDLPTPLPFPIIRTMLPGWHLAQMRLRKHMKERVVPFRIIMIVWCILVVAWTCGASGAEPGGDSDTILFRKSLGDGCEMVVVRGPRRDASVLKAKVDKEDSDKISGVYAVRLELQSPKEPPLVLWTRLKREPRGEGGDRVFEVLDLLVEPTPGHIVMATCEMGDIHLWEIYPITDGNPATHTQLYGWDWSQVALAKPPTHERVKIALSRSKDQKLAIEVVDTAGSGPHQHTVFEQVDEKWEFKSARQWRGGPEPEPKK